MILTEELLDRIKRCELRLLEGFISVCSDLKLTYYVAYGTALGAVRHKGFIPWDDDVDVMMPRQDYKIFLERGQTLLSKFGGYFLQTIDTDPQYYQFYAKVRDSNTTFIEKVVSDRKMNHGVFMDIFPIDYFPANALRKKYVLWLNYPRHLRTELFERKAQSNHPLLKDILQRMLSMAYPKVDNMIHAHDVFLEKIPESDTMIDYSGCGLQGSYTFPFACLGDGCIGKFEHLEVMLPHDYDCYLRYMYGDYMKLPPKEQQIPHHYCDIIDLEKPFTFYEETFEQKNKTA